jgi:hypothetical protein
MSLWHPNDLLTDLDLAGYERTILTQFGEVDWPTRRQKALDDWLFPLMEGRGFPPSRFRTRAKADQVYSFSATFTDQNTGADTSDGLDLSSLLSTSSKYLYIGAKTPFRGISVRMLDAVNAVSNTLTVQVWADRWVTVTHENGTLVGAVTFARGGAITWPDVVGVVTREVSTSDPMYWVRLSLSAAPTASTAIGPVSVIRRSRLSAAATYRTLMHIFREAPISQEGPWLDKAAWYEAEAEKAWLRVADQIGPEFDTDGDDKVDGDENTQTAKSVTGGGWSLERA